MSVRRALGEASSARSQPVKKFTFSSVVDKESNFAFAIAIVSSCCFFVCRRGSFDETRDGLCAM